MIYDHLGVRGLDTEWAMTTEHQTPEEMLREFKRMLRQKKDEEEKAKTQIDGEFQMWTNASDALFPYDVDTERRLSLDRMSVSQKVEARVSNAGTVELQGQVHARNGLGVGQVHVAYKHQLTAHTFAKGTFGTDAARLLLHHEFSQYTFGEIMASYSMKDALQPWTLAVMVGRQLTKHVMGTVSFFFGGTEAVETSLMSVGTRNRYKASLQFTREDVTGTIEYGHRISNRSQTLVDASYSLRGAVGLSVGAERRMTERTSMLLKVGISMSEGIVLEPGVSRGGFRFSFPFIIYPVLDPLIGLGTLVAASLSVGAIKSLIINPSKERKAAREIVRTRKERLDVTRKRRDAMLESLVALKPLAEKRREQERKRKGLVIEKAWYGNIEGLTVHIADPDFAPYIEVQDQLQMLTHDDKLHLTAQPKHGMADFYDCCPGELKQCS